MAENDIEIKIRVDAQGAITILDQTGKAISQVGTASDKAALGLSKAQAKILTFNQAAQGFQVVKRLITEAYEVFDKLIQAGDKLDDLTTGFNALGGTAGQLNKLRDASRGLISDTDLLTIANKALLSDIPNIASNLDELTGATMALAKATGQDEKQALDSMITSLQTGNDRAIKAMIGKVDLKKAEEDYAKSLGVTAKQLTEEGKLYADRLAIQQKLIEKAKELPPLNDSAADSLNKVKIAVEGLITQIGSDLNSSIGLISALKWLKAQVDLVNLGWKEFKRLTDEASAAPGMKDERNLAEQTRDQNAINQAVEKYWKTQEKTVAAKREDHIITTELTEDEKQFIKYLEDTYQLSEAAAKALLKQAEATDQLKKNQQKAIDLGIAPERPVILSASRVKSTWGDLSNQLGDLFKADVSGGIANGIQGGLANIHDLLFQAIEEGGFNHEMMRDFAEEMATTAGGAIGEALGGPAGQVIGEALGKLAGKAISNGIEHAFGGGANKENEARKKIRKYFMEMLGDEELTLIVDGQMKKFNQLFAHATRKTAYESGKGGPFAGLGEAFKALMDDEKLVGSQLEAILGSNVENLNNLQIALNQSGISAEKFGEALEEAFLNGEISAQQFLDSSAKVRDLFEKGIPGAVGATTEAFDNLVSGALASGRIAQDAFSDLAAEAKEKGFSTLEQLKQDLIASGKYTAEQIEILFQALSDKGVETLDDLLNLDVTKTAELIKSMQDAGFDFQKPLDNLKEIKKTLDEIPSEKNVVVHVDATLTPDARLVLGGGEGGPKTGTFNGGNNGLWNKVKSAGGSGLFGTGATLGFSWDYGDSGGGSPRLLFGGESADPMDLFRAGKISPKATMAALRALERRTGRAISDSDVMALFKGGLSRNAVIKFLGREQTDRGEGLPGFANYFGAARRMTAGGYRGFSGLHNLGAELEEGGLSLNQWITNMEGTSPDLANDFRRVLGKHHINSEQDLMSAEDVEILRMLRELKKGGHLKKKVFIDMEFRQNGRRIGASEAGEAIDNVATPGVGRKRRKRKKGHRQAAGA